MSSIYLCVAGLNIKVDIIYESTKEFLKEYLISPVENPNIETKIDEEAILEEKEMFRKTQEFAQEELVDYGDEYYEMSAVFRQIAKKLPFFDAIAFHGSVISVDDVAYMFAGKSGAGKSTHAAFWREMLGEKAITVNDDKPFLRLIDGTVYAYGSPWCGKHGLNTNCKKPLKAICFIKQGKENFIKEVSTDAVTGILLQQSYRPPQADTMCRTMEILDNFRKSIKYFEMTCIKDISAAEMSYEYMKERV